MKDVEIPALVELVIKEATAACQITPADIQSSSSRNPQHVEARRLAVFILKEKLGFKTKFASNALHLKGQTIYNLLPAAINTYGKKGAEYQGFTDAVDATIEKVVKQFGTIEEIQAVITGTTGTSMPNNKPHRSKSGATKATHKKAAATAPPTSNGTDDGNGNSVLYLVIYALSRVEGATPERLSEAFKIGIPGIERAVGHTILSSNRDTETASVRTGIDRFYTLAPADANGSK